MLHGCITYHMVGMCTGDGNLEVKVVDVDLPKPEVRVCPHWAEPRRSSHRRWCQHRVAKMTCTEDDDE